MANPIQTKPVPYCPDCGAQMVLRIPRGNKQFDPFWGCSRFPDCRGSRNILPNGKPEMTDDEENWNYMKERL